MKIASITEAKNQLSALLDLVRAGQTVVITDRGVPIARLEPAAMHPDSEGRIARLQRAGIISSKPRKPLPPDFFARPRPRPRNGVSLVDLVLKEREEGY
jgi:prevent-host-death family protein